VNDGFFIPTSYEQWRHCIEVRGRVRLTPSYISQRLSELQNKEHPKTTEFSRLYGPDHLRLTISWFRRAENELSGELRSHRHV